MQQKQVGKTIRRRTQHDSGETLLSPKPPRKTDQVAALLARIDSCLSRPS